MRRIITRLQRRIEGLREFDPTSITERNNPQIDALETSIQEVLAAAFGEDTPVFARYRAAASLDTASINLMYPTPMPEVRDGLVRGKARAIALLNEAIRSFEERLEEFDEVTTSNVGSQDAPEAQPSDEVFIVHGRDDRAKHEVARLISKAGLTPVILHEQANAGQTIIEKFERHSAQAGFAVVLLTPDDVGGPGPDQLQPRARQNVIGEMFWFAGKLGRSHVCALKKGDLEMPSDFAGIGYTDLDDRGAWKAELLRELTAAGYEVDWATALG